MNFLESHPELAKQLHPDKNGGLITSSLSKGSHKKVWWLCASGHEWEAEVASRASQNRGCPICSNQRIVKGVNDFSTTRPDLVPEWHSLKNVSLDPHSLSSGNSRVKVWWICSKGHEWQATLAKRSAGSGCPICSGNVTQPGINDLQTLRPDLLEEWDNDRNQIPASSVSVGSSKKVWWRCGKQHSWTAAVHSRAKGAGCPFCANLKILEGYNDLQTLAPQVAKDWHPLRNGDLKPTEVGATSPRRVWWLCPRGHETKVSIYARTKGSSCGVCLNQVLQPGVNDLRTTHEAVWAQLDLVRSGLSQDSVLSPGSKRKTWWICERGHSWEAPINKRVAGSGCHVCLNLITAEGHNDLRTTDPEMASEWDEGANEVLVSEVNSAYPKKVWWKCPKGHSYQMSPLLRRRGSGCTICANKVVATGVNDLATTNPKLAEEWNFELNGLLSPASVVGGSTKKVWWRCPQGHDYEARVYSRLNGSGCQVCQGNALWTGFNDLLSLHPKLASEFDLEKNAPLNPSTVLGGGLLKHWWRCPDGHSYLASVSKRVAGRACPVCANKVIVPGVNDLATTNPKLASEWNHRLNKGSSITSVSSGSSKKVWWMCNTVHEWEATIASRSQGVGCPDCAEYGFSSVSPAVIYFIHHRTFKARKVGIMNSSSDRLAHFLTMGWNIVYKRETEVGAHARKVESAFFRWIRDDLGVPEFLGKAEMGRRGGGTETFGMEIPLDEEVIQFISASLDAAES